MTEPNPTHAQRETSSAPDGCLCGTCRPDLHEAYRRETADRARLAAETETP